MGETLRAAWGDRIRRSIRLDSEELLARVWSTQRESQRIAVPATQRAESRQQKRTARELVSIRPELSLRTLLVLTGRVLEPDREINDESALAGGVAAVDSTLPERLRPALARFVEGTPNTSLREQRALSELCEWTERLLDDRSPRERKVGQWLPWVGLAAAVLLLGYALVTPRNVAYGKSVTASSLCSLTPPQRPGQERLGRVTDGVVLEAPGVGSEWAETNFALCTNQEKHPWVTVDLGREYSLSSAVVYNRSDCCWGQSDLPLSIQTSSDNMHFETVATRDKPFTTELPWSSSLGGRKARYVRLYVASPQGRSIVVSELEVYGR